MDENGGRGPRGFSGLASRFRRAVSELDDARRRAAEEAERARQEAQAARAALFADLARFATDVGAIQAVAEPDGLSLRYGGRQVRFVAEGEHDRIRVERDGDEPGTVFRQPELDYRWVYARRRRGREERVPLLDQGLEDLLVNGLGLPPPSNEAAAAPASSRDREL